jgi:hypothetical protein
MRVKVTKSTQSIVVSLKFGDNSVNVAVSFLNRKKKSNKTLTIRKH